MLTHPGGRVNRAGKESGCQVNRAGRRRMGGVCDPPRISGRWPAGRAG
jgi:hypothetical protein